MRQLLYSKPSYTKFTLATRKFQKTKAVTGIKNEIWCKDLAYVDELAKDNNDLESQLVCQDLFDRTVDAKRTKTKVSKETVRAFSTTIRKKNRPKKIRLDKRIEFVEEFQKHCKVEGIQIYSTTSETKAGSAEHTIRSLKNILYSHMEDCGYKYIPKMSQLVTTLNSMKNCSTDLIPKNVKRSDFLPTLFSKPLGEYLIQVQDSRETLHLQVRLNLQEKL